MKFQTLSIAAALLMGAGWLCAVETKSALDSTDEKFVKQAAMDGQSEVRLGQLAIGKADDVAVKAVGQRIVKDHTMANNELDALAKSKGVELSVAGDPDTDKAIASLEKDSGKDFDKAFLTKVQKDHKKNISDFETESKDAKDGDVKAWVDKTLPTLKAHLDMINTTLTGK